MRILARECRLIVPVAQALEELGGPDMLLRLPDRVQLLATDLLAHYARERPPVARLMADPRVRRLDTAGQLFVRADQDHARYSADAHFRADWDALGRPAPLAPEPPQPDVGVVIAAHALVREDPPGLPALVLAPASHFQWYAAGDAERVAVIAAGVVAELLTTGLAANDMALR